jgi:hypothetical protein
VNEETLAHWGLLRQIKKIQHHFCDTLIVVIINNTAFRHLLQTFESPTLFQQTTQSAVF